MSVGDILITDDGKNDIFEAAEIGWNHLGTITNPRVLPKESSLCPHCFEKNKKTDKPGFGIVQIKCSNCSGLYHYEKPNEARERDL